MPAGFGNDGPERPALGHNLTLGLVDLLGQEILVGEYPDGVLPTEPELVRRFAVSRTVVREAVKMLAAKGLVVTRPRQGTVIEPYKTWNLLDPLVLKWMVDGAAQPALLRQLCEFSISIEPAAAALAALGGTARDRAAIAVACDRLGEAGGDPSGRRDATMALHRTIIAASGNVFYLNMIEAVGAAHRILARHGRAADPPALLRRYRRLADAIEMRAPERARQEMAGLLELVFEPIMGRPAAA